MTTLILGSVNPTCQENETYNFTTYFSTPLSLVGKPISVQKVCLDTRFRNVDDFEVKSCHFVPTG